MEFKEYRFDEVTINFDKKEFHFLAHSEKEYKANIVTMVLKV